MVTQFQNYNYIHPFKINGHKTEFLESFIKILKNNTFMATFYDKVNNTSFNRVGFKMVENLMFKASKTSGKQ